jgi:hypothetical protein
MRKFLRKSFKLSFESLAQRLKAEQADESGEFPISFWSRLMYNPSVQTRSFAPRFATPQIQNSQLRFMMIRKSLDVLRVMFIGSFLFVLPYGAFAQDQKQPAEKQPAKKSKAGADSCDGALDIVPGKPATFTRKRRPSKSETKSEAKSESKPESKPDANPRQ